MTQFPGGIAFSVRKKIGAAMGEFRMIRPGDRILVGLSGGKDSLLLALALSEFKSRSPFPFSIQGCTVDITAGLLDTSPLQEFCDALGIPYSVRKHPIAEILQVRKERSPCSLCANIRRGILNSEAQERGCTLLALGHNLDDVAETALMNLFHTGRFRAFQPKSFQSRSGITVIRPLVFVEERKILREVRRLGLPVLPYVCPFSPDTERSAVKNILARISADTPHIKYNILHALRCLDEQDRWSCRDCSAENQGPPGEERGQEPGAGHR